MGLRRVALALVLALACVGTAGAQNLDPSSSQNVAPSAAPKSLAALEEQRQGGSLPTMLRDPGDLDVAFEYAAISVQLGDVESAISTLERMLIFSPGLPQLQLELGVLYYRLGAYPQAETYFRAVAANPSVPARGPGAGRRVPRRDRERRARAGGHRDAHDRHPLAEQCQCRAERSDDPAQRPAVHAQSRRDGNARRQRLRHREPQRLARPQPPGRDARPEPCRLQRALSQPDRVQHRHRRSEGRADLHAPALRDEQRDARLLRRRLGRDPRRLALPGRARPRHATSASRSTPARA